MGMRTSVMADYEQPALTCCATNLNIRRATCSTHLPCTVPAAAGYDQYTLVYSACNLHPLTNRSMLDVYRDLIASTSPAAANLRTIVVSSGDIDPVVSLHGTEAAIMAIGFDIALGESRRPWFYNSTAAPLELLRRKPIPWGQSLHAGEGGVQIGGFVFGLDLRGGRPHRLASPMGASNLTFNFVTVRNSGHMVPQYAPQRSLHVIRRLMLGGHALAPPLPSDWSKVSDEVFYSRGSSKPGLFAQWVADASSANYVQNGS